MPRPVMIFATFVVVTAALALAPAHAVAWRAVVLQADRSGTDLGRLERSPAVFVTLPDVGDGIDLAVVPGDGGSLRLYVPDREPERSWLERRSSLPRITAPGATFDADSRQRVVREPATGLRFRPIGTLQLPGSRSEVRVRLEAGTRPIRALVAPVETDFKLDEAHRVPTTVARMRSWYDEPADGRQLEETEPADRTTARTAALLAGGIVLLMLVLAAWWVRRGRGSARARGIERFGGG